MLIIFTPCVGEPLARPMPVMIWPIMAVTSKECRAGIGIWNRVLGDASIYLVRTTKACLFYRVAIDSVLGFIIRTYKESPQDG